MRNKLKFKIMLPILQILLCFVAFIIDQSVNHGVGEGENQIRANLASNVEFFIKGFLGYDDIANYNFRLQTALLAIGFWYLVGLAIDKCIKKIRK